MLSRKYQIQWAGVVWNWESSEGDEVFESVCEAVEVSLLAGTWSMERDNNILFEQNVAFRVTKNS